jgi:hypothetical protein
MSDLEPGKPGGPDGPPGDADAPTAEKTPEELAAEEREKRRRLVAARLIVAGVGLTFLIVGFVDFITKSH